MKKLAELYPASGPEPIEVATTKRMIHSLKNYDRLVDLVKNLRFCLKHCTKIAQASKYATPATLKRDFEALQAVERFEYDTEGENG
jgi:hypothetical protein